MTTPTDWRALCAIAVELWDADCGMESVMEQMRTALAQPEPQGPTDEGIEERFQRWWFNEYCARWGRPAIEPVPEAKELPALDLCAKFQVFIELIASRKEGNQELMICRWPTDGSWAIEIGNPSNYVQLGEVGGEITAGGPSLASAIASLATELNAADFLGRPAIQPVPVSERLPGAEDCAPLRGLGESPGAVAGDPLAASAGDGGNPGPSGDSGPPDHGC